MRIRYSLAAVICLVVSLGVSLIAKKKDPDDFTQTLALPKDPPAVAIGETRKLLFQVSPLSGKGLLSQQTRDALKAILKENGGAPVIHIRAFVAGSGDVRRVPQIVSEVFTEKRLPTPSVSVVLCGGLPLENAQVVLEAVSVVKKDVNPAGLGFLSGEERVSEGSPAVPVRALLEKSLGDLAAQMPAGNALEVSCFVSDLTDALHLTSDIVGRFPGAAVDLVQTERAPYRALAHCEGVARGGSANAAELAFSGTRVAFGTADKDAALAFQRLDKDLREAGAQPSDIAFKNIYALSPTAAAAARRTGPAGSSEAVFPFEGVASIDAGFAVDVVAAASR